MPMQCMANCMGRMGDLLAGKAIDDDARKCSYFHELFDLDLKLLCMVGIYDVGNS